MGDAWAFDRKAGGGSPFLVGVDEAGRGALGGPVVAGAVVLPARFWEIRGRRKACAGFRDSKLVPEAEREELFGRLEAWRVEGSLDWAAGAASVGEIEAWNILGATRMAMTRALEVLQDGAGEAWKLPGAEMGPLLGGGRSLEGTVWQEPPEALILVDGRPLRPFPYRHTAVVDGDALSLAIAMASIVAKVTRDRGMAELEREHPGYGWKEHKGYGTPDHRARIQAMGPSEAHRRGFLRGLLAEMTNPEPEQPDLEGI